MKQNKYKYDVGTTHKIDGKKVKVIEVYGKYIGFGRVKYDDGIDIDIMFNLLSK